MKKMKVLLLSLALGCTFVAAATAVGCKKENKGPSSSFEWSEDSGASEVILRFDSSYVEVRQYESKSLGCTMKGATGKVKYASSDNSVATVDENGVVTTYGKLAKATITATIEGVEGVSAACEVNVVQSPYVPEIVFEETAYTIETGEKLQFAVSTEWNNVAIAEAITYAVSFADGYENVQSTIAVNGNEITVQADNTVGAFDIVVSATVRGIYTSESVTVNVVPSKLKLQPSSTDFVPANGKYTTQIYTTSRIDAAQVDRVPLDFAVMKGGEEKTADITWEVETIKDDRTISVVNGVEKVLPAAEVVDGVLIAKRRGGVKVTGTATVAGETATVEVICEIVPPEVKLTQTAELEVANLGTLKIEEDVVGKLERADFNGKKVGSVMPRSKNIALTNYATEEDKNNKTNPLFPSAAKDLGRKQLIIYTDLVRYIMDVDVYTLVINDADEFDSILKNLNPANRPKDGWASAYDEAANTRGIAWTGEMELNTRYNQIKSSEYYDGYFVLGNDIDYNRTVTCMTDTGSVWWSQGTTDDFNRGFRGVFDGKGYNIDGVTVGKNPSGEKESGGIFGYISKTGIVRNVSFTNAVLHANQGFICAMGDGTIENVSISYKKIGGNKETSMETATPRTMGSFFSWKSGSNATVRNCLVDASAADITVEKGTYKGEELFNIKLAGTAKNTENVVVICPNQEVLAYSGADITRLTYNDVMKETDLFKNFDREIWTLTEEGLPMFVNQAANLDKNAPIEFLNVDDVLVAGFEMLVLTNNPYVKIEIDEVRGVTYESSLLKATEDAFTQYVTLTATSLLNPEITATHRVYIDSFGKEVAAPQSPTQPTVYNTDNSLEIGDNSWMGEKNYVYLGAHVISEGDGTEEIKVDLNALQWGDNDVTIVCIDANDERTHFNVTLKKWYTSAEFKDSVIVANTVFSDMREFVDAKGRTITFTEVATEEKAEGYTKVTQFNCPMEWESALTIDMFDKQDIRGYSDLWFGVKIANGRFICQETDAQTIGWVYFHFTQTSDSVWTAEVTIDGKVYKNVFDIKDMGGHGTTQRVCDLLYRGGWGFGFMWYNNNTGTVFAETPTIFHVTEIRGTLKQA